jgi:transposase
MPSGRSSPRHLPAEVPGRRVRPRTWPLRTITDAILYVDWTGCAWRYLPSDFPPWRAVYGYFAARRDDGTLARLHDALSGTDLSDAQTFVTRA